MYALPTLLLIYNFAEIFGDSIVRQQSKILIVLFQSCGTSYTKKVMGNGNVTGKLENKTETLKKIVIIERESFDGT